jgi:hypothetical protein
VAETNVEAAGSVSVNVTPVASVGPALATVTVYVKGLPLCAGFGAAVLVTERSAKVQTTSAGVVLQAAPPPDM